MPYFVATRCTVLGPKAAVARLRALAFCEDQYIRPGGTMFDFERILPMPALDRTTQKRIVDLMEKRLPEGETLKILRRLTNDAAEEWRDYNWGALSNGYDVCIEATDPFEFLMQTDSGFPAPVFVKIAKLFPELSFNCAFHGFHSSPSDLGYCRELDGDDPRLGGQGWFNPPAGEALLTSGRATPEIIRRVRRDRRLFDQEQDFAKSVVDL